MIKYDNFLKNKRQKEIITGLTKIPKLNDKLFDFQKDIVKWALIRGRACVFAGCGMGKTIMQLEWARCIPENILIVAPLSVAFQTIREANKFNIFDISYSKDGVIKDKITITNYENLHKFDPSKFNGIVLDESSILKNYISKFRNMIIDNWENCCFKLACSATPAPNDYMELGNHAEFMGVMTRTEMLSMYFIHDGGETQKWRLKGHAKNKFFEWMASWSVMLNKPSDLGYKDDAFILPKLNIHYITLPSKTEKGRVLPKTASTLQERQQARRNSIDERTDKAAEIANKIDGHVILWGNLNNECDALELKVNDCIQVAGRHQIDDKIDKMNSFTNGKVKALVSKPKIAGHGMNWQHCSNMLFVGLSDSFEQMYQAIRRCWRFGQKKEVNVYIITTFSEGNVTRNIKRKEKQAEDMQKEMIKYMHKINEKNIKNIKKDSIDYKPGIQMEIPKFL